MKEPQHNQLNWLHVYYVCRYFICLNMDLIMQTGAKQSEFQAVGDRRGGGRLGGKRWFGIILTYWMGARTQMFLSFAIYTVRTLSNPFQTSISI